MGPAKVNPPGRFRISHDVADPVGECPHGWGKMAVPRVENGERRGRSGIVREHLQEAPAAKMINHHVTPRADYAQAFETASDIGIGVVDDEVFLHPDGAILAIYHEVPHHGARGSPGQVAYGLVLSQIVQ